MWYLVTFFILKIALTDAFFSNTPISTQCINLCKDSLPPLYFSTNFQNKEHIICQRGCRLFSIIHLNDFSINTTKKECHLSCEEGYPTARENAICKIGCNLMAKKRENETPTFLIVAEDGTSNTMFIAEPDTLEVLEPDTLADPSIKSQLEIGFNTDYKIPETHIRTMPINSNNQMVIIKTTTYTGDWLDCASRNSGIPRWILLTAILSAVLLALWLSFSADKKSNKEDNFDIADEMLKEQEIMINFPVAEENGIPPEKSYEGCEKDPSLFQEEDVKDEKDPSVFPAEEVNFSSPPKYSVDNENV